MLGSRRKKGDKLQKKTQTFHLLNILIFIFFNVLKILQGALKLFKAQSSAGPHIQQIYSLERQKLLSVDLEVITFEEQGPGAWEAEVWFLPLSYTSCSPRENHPAPL